MSSSTAGPLHNLNYDQLLKKQQRQLVNALTYVGGRWWETSEIEAKYVDKKCSFNSSQKGSNIYT